MKRGLIAVKSTLFEGMRGLVAERSMGRMPCLYSVWSLARLIIKYVHNNQNMMAIELKTNGWIDNMLLV